MSLQDAFVDDLIAKGPIRSPAVEAAFRAVPRHLFVPHVPHEAAYQDQSIPTKRLDGGVVSSSSQPAIMAVMLEQLGLEPGHRVLEIGAGTGYNAALMAHIVGPQGQVITIDIDLDIVEAAQQHLSDTGVEGVRVVQGDGGLGYASGGPYDRIIFTVGAGDIRPNWLAQLNPGGRLLAPLSLKGGIQVSAAFEQVGGGWETISVKPCGFMRLRGAFAEQSILVHLGPERGLHLATDSAASVDAEAIYCNLNEPGRVEPTGTIVGPGEIYDLQLWLALQDTAYVSLMAIDDMAARGIVPNLYHISSQTRFSTTFGLVSGESLCVLVRSVAQPDEDAIALSVLSFGPKAQLAGQLIKQLSAWDAAGRPSAEGLSIQVYPKSDSYDASSADLIIRKKEADLIINWPRIYP